MKMAHVLYSLSFICILQDSVSDEFEDMHDLVFGRLKSNRVCIFRVHLHVYEFVQPGKQLFIGKHFLFFFFAQRCVRGREVNFKV